MEQNDWLALMEAAVEAALGASTTDLVLEHFQEAGVCSVRALSAASNSRCNG